MNRLKCRFFYGNVLSLWSIISDAFPGELPRPITLDGIQTFLHGRRISMSDTVVKCERKNPTALDEDLIPLILHHDIIPQLKASQVSHILFISGFGKNNAFKLFYEDILGQKITASIKREREIALDPGFLGRPVKSKVLYSPSSSSNRSMPRTRLYQRNKHLYKDAEKPIIAFKVDHYRTNLS